MHSRESDFSRYKTRSFVFCSEIIGPLVFSTSLYQKNLLHYKQRAQRLNLESTEELCVLRYTYCIKTEVVPVHAW
jgi:hypothetical protein